MRFLLQRFVLPILCIVEIQPAAAQPFRVDTLARFPEVSSPVSLAFSPDNRGKIFFTEKSSGRVRVFENNAVLRIPFATVRVASTGEQGLLGITLHPRYPDSPYVYILYTRSSDRANVIVRYRDSSNVGIQRRLIFVVQRTNNATVQNGGNIHFGPDEMLYVSVGDFGVPSNALDTTDSKNTRGKILRLNPDGSVPADNPFNAKPFWSYGHRNSFDFTFDLETGKMYCSENRPDGNNLVLQVSRQENAGDAKGVAAVANPLFSRPLNDSQEHIPSLTGIVVYRNKAFPKLHGKILLADNNNRTVWAVSQSNDDTPLMAEEFSRFFDRDDGIADIEADLDGYIYLTSGQGSFSKILRLRPVAPAFASVPLRQATQDVEYSYQPTIDGTPPEVSIIAGPSRMVIDQTGTLRWTPTNADALRHEHGVILRVENGAGYVDQEYAIQVANVNDPPSLPSLVSPVSDTTLNFIGSNPEIHFSWMEATDPDLDTLRYTLEIDTVSTFTAPASQSISVGRSTTVLRAFPRRTQEYFWRVKVSDGTLSSTTIFRSLSIAFIQPVVEETGKTSESMLQQNFPNPFNPSTSIKYTIPKSGHVRLVVFNLLGQEVAVIYEGVQTAGTYEFEFKIGELPSGIYFYRIQAPDFVETKKMIVTK